MRWWHGTVARLRLLFARRAAEGRMDEEIRFHVEMEAERLVRTEHLAPDEARRRALVAFGGVQGHREALRDGRGLAWLDGLTLDLRLGVRMLRKYPGLTVVAVCGIAMAVAMASVMFTLVGTMTNATLPFPEGERIVGIRTWDRRANDPAPSTTHDLAAWRQQLSSMAEVGAFRTVRRNVMLPGALPEPMDAAEMTASAFRVTGVAPLLGRYFDEDDERAGAPPVVMLGHDLWRTRFDGDPSVIGRSLRLGRTEHAIVGIMPRGYGFPVSHQMWTPLRADPFALPRGAGSDFLVLARLSSGATSEAAQAELTAVNRRRLAESPGARGDLEPRIVSFPALVGVVEESEEEAAVLAFLIPSLNSLLLIVICINVAVLVYARTATRQAEFAVRVSLGASRRRIVGQLFAEALVLAGAGAAAGLVAGAVAYRLMRGLAGRDDGFTLPFWMPPGLAPGAVLFVVALTLLAALIIGVIPARHAMGKRVRETLSELSGGASIRLGRAWTVMIVTQVAIAVAALPGIVYLSASYGWYAMTPTGLPGEEFLVAQVEWSGEEPGGMTGRLSTLESLVEREPGAVGATFSSHVPGREAFASVELEEVPGSPANRRREVRTMAVAADFFAVFGIPILDGRALHSGDAVAEAGGVIVNATFARDILAGGNAVGRRIRFAAQRDAAPQHPWHEIVGVVPDFPNRMNPVVTQARMYTTMVPDRAMSAMLTARVPSGPMALGERLRSLATSVDPELQLRKVQPLDRFYDQVRASDRWTATLMGLVTLCVLLLSAAGMYALMSVTVTRRRREIGIRSALGAQPRRLVASILARALGQLAMGAAVGIFVAALLGGGSGGEMMGDHAELVLPGVLIMVLITVALAALGPARRSLRIHPAEALKSE